MKLFLFLCFSLSGILQQTSTVFGEEYQANNSPETNDALEKMIDTFATVEYGTLLKLESFLNIINTKDTEYHKYRSRKITQRIENAELIRGNASVCLAIRNNLQENFHDDDSNNMEHLSNNFTIKSDEISILMEDLKQVKKFLLNLLTNETITKDQLLIYIYEQIQKKKTNNWRDTTIITVDYFKNINANIELSNNIEKAMIEQLNVSCGRDDFATTAATILTRLPLSAQSNLKRKISITLSDKIQQLIDMKLDFLSITKDHLSDVDYVLNKTRNQIIDFDSLVNNDSNYDSCKMALKNETFTNFSKIASESISICINQFINSTDKKIKLLFEYKENPFLFIQQEMTSKVIVERETFTQDFPYRIEYELNRKNKLHQVQLELDYINCIIKITDNAKEMQNFIQENITKKCISNK